MLPEPGVFLLLCLFGAWVALDSTSCGQLMISRPIVAATIAGWIAGEPAQGATVGLLLEAFHLTVLPVGAARYPEGGPAAVVAAGVYASYGPGGSALLTAVVFAFVWEWVAGTSVRMLRQGNVRLVAQPVGRGDSPSELERRHLLAVGADFLRGLVLIATGVPLLAALLALVTPLWELGDRVPGVVLGAAAAGALAGALQLFRGSGRIRLFVIGAAVGLLGLVL